MTVNFIERPSGPSRLVCDAELHLDGDLAGFKLVGFSLWRSAEGEIFVSLPARAFGSGGERRYFDLLRSIEGDAARVRDLKAAILEEYHTATGANLPERMPERAVG